MIKSIKIKNFAIIKDTEFNFHSGLNIITGETGAGKSVVATAISLALGSRADSTFIRHGASKATVEMLAEFGDKEYTVVREISSNGKNRCIINGDGVPLGRLISISEKNAQIHGQFDNNLLLNPETHIDLLDTFGGQNILSYYLTYINSFNEFSDIKNRYNKLVTSIKEDSSKADYYRYSIEEIDRANLLDGEDAELEDRMKFLQNAEAISRALSDSYDALSSGDFSAENLIGSALSNIKSVSEYTKDIDSLSDNLESLSIQLSDIISKMHTLLDSSDFSERELDEIMERLSLIDSLKKKYAPTIREIISHRNELSEKLNNMESFDEQKEALKALLEESRLKLYSDGNALTEARKKVGKELSEAVVSELTQLNFKDADIEVAITPLKAPGPKGIDEVELFITTNKGEPLKPLAKVASGGEVSRIMLAIKAITADSENISTLIFDEVDTGISGITASIVSNKLQSLARNHQVISITHLPQIAAKGDHNYRIYKESDDSETFAYVEEITGEDKLMEIARLLGGTKITKATIENARDLIESH
ncbi:MAG: DNA repair protein RecN [Clostridiales bacterium]|nr:DNA repair protein RecN [Clostridiales bacterium]MDY6117411.1 DNA repair protein RecN [Anaerovoracaceae bacterium]